MSKALENWLPHSDESFELFQVWEMSSYVVLPFPGAWVDQPYWVKDDFFLFLRLSRWWDMNEKLPTAEGLPNAEDV